MKRLLFLYLITVCAAQDSVPHKTAERLDKLTQSYEAALERVTQPLRKTYLAELEKLKTEFVRAGDLASALAVDARIKALASPPAKPDEPTAPERYPTNKEKVAADAKTFGRDELIKQLPPANRGVTRRDVLKWLEGGTWRAGSEVFRLDAGGKGARLTSYAGLESTLTWRYTSEGLIELRGAGSIKLIRMTGQDAGVGIMPGQQGTGVFNFIRETSPPPALTEGKH